MTDMPISISRLRLSPIAISFVVLVSGCLSSAAADEAVSFNRDVRPILSDRCFKCHGPDATNQESEFRLDTFAHATDDLGGYAGIVPGQADESELIARIIATDDGQMPPADQLRQLTDEQKRILTKWIDEGARFDSHWSFKSLPPNVESPRTTSDWPRGEIDRFVLRGLQNTEFVPNRDAPREKWLRRVTFDLTGLPPTLAEIDAFVADTSEDANERIVDRLLQSEACAERLASEWLDVARYSDSYGYQRDDERFVWPWRDWVVSAFHDNMPYDEFITWQLAGDLMPDPSPEQILATTFNRLHSHKKEGGVAIEEFRIENVADRTHTMAAAFLGMTMQCCRCHDHKYDPLTTKEYYQLSSFFANVDENGLISYFTDAVPTPAVAWANDTQQTAIDEARKVVQVSEQTWKKAEADCTVRFDAWLSKWQETEGAVELDGLVASLSFEEFVALPTSACKDETGKNISPEKVRGIKDLGPDRDSAVTTMANELVEGPAGKAIQLTGDDAVVLPGVGHYARHQSFSIAAWINPAEIETRGVIFRRSRGWDDAGSVGYELTKEGDRLSAKLCHFWPGDAICVETTVPIAAKKWQHVVVSYDGSSRAAGLKIYLNGDRADTVIVQDHLTRNITEWRQGYADLAIGSRYRDRGFTHGKVDEFRVFERELAAVEAQQLFDGLAITELKETPRRKWSDAQRTLAQEYFATVVDETVRDAKAKLTADRQRLNAIIDSIPAITVMREQADPRTSYVLKRGAYDQRGEPVTAETPAFLPAYPEDAPRNRLGLARWLTLPEHPLTARVTVNRYWQMIFGHGLVRTPEDFGNQGEPPTHPKLLDWLARDFVEHDWDVRRLLRMMVLSSTYRQSAIVSRDLRGKDPENRLLARGPNQRLSAEMIRDNVLAVSGLLVSESGGPPVKPYDVALAYTPLPVDKGDGLYRRSLYTFWKRTAPAPVMMAMNATTREVCRLRREVTDSPLQALVLLNGPQFVEAARVLAADLIERHGEDVSAVSGEAFKRLTSRDPSSREMEILRALHAEQLVLFRANPKQAVDLLGVGSFPHPKSVLDSPDLAARHAAATVLVNSIMNFDESVRQQ